MIPQEIRTIISETIIAKIDYWAEENLREEFRSHLGASVIGTSCSRAIWYKFRWVKPEKLKGQNLRLLRRGQREESNFHEFLRGIGCTVSEIDPETGKQWRVTASQGHFGGSADCLLTLPTWFEFPQEYGLNEQILGEFKTASESNFNKICKDGIKIAKPEYWAQANVLGYLLKLKYVMFFIVNKNTDELHIELHQLDHDFGRIYLEKADSIINSQTAPIRYANSPSNFVCKYCTFKEICHLNGAAVRNCRSCSKAEPISEGKWHCSMYNQTIPDEFLSKGCDYHQDITLVQLQGGS